jgi:hypothetical protein
MANSEIQEKRRAGMANDKQDLKAKAQCRAAGVIKSARLKKSDSTTEGLRKLSVAMSKEFGKDYHTKLKPLGIALSEKVKHLKIPKQATGSGTVKCRFPPWSCGPDVDF